MLKPDTRDSLLLAIAKARAWIDDFASGRVGSFGEIAQREEKVERHIRLLAPLAFTPPAMVAAIIAGAAPADLTVTSLARAMPCTWSGTESAATG
jgi:site-specific DNA recombinase